QTLSAKVKNAPAGTALDDINFVSPSIGTITGAGTVSAAHELDFKMRVMPISGIANIATLGSKNGIPFTISGTSDNPYFKPDVKGMATERLKDFSNTKDAVEQGVGLIQGLFGKKKDSKQ